MVTLCDEPLDININKIPNRLTNVQLVSQYQNDGTIHEKVGEQITSIHDISAQHKNNQPKVR